MLGLSSRACVLYPFSKDPPAKGSMICFILLTRNMDKILSSVSVFVVYSNTLCCFSISNYTYILDVSFQNRLVIFRSYHCKL